MKRIRNWSTK